jgi:hypothetical protein
MLPPLVEDAPQGLKEEYTSKLLSQLKYDLFEAQDNLITTKAAQATQSNKHCAIIIIFKAGDHVLLVTKH